MILRDRTIFQRITRSISQRCNHLFHRLYPPTMFLSVCIGILVGRSYSLLIRTTEVRIQRHKYIRNLIVVQRIHPIRHNRFVRRYPRRIIPKLSKRKDIRENQITSRRCRLIHRMSKAFCRRNTDRKTTLGQKLVILFCGKFFAIHLDLRFHFRIDSDIHSRRVTHNVEFRKLVDIFRNPVCIHQNLGMTKHIFSTEYNRFIIVLDRCLCFPNRTPANIDRVLVVRTKDVHCMMRLAPDTIQLREIRNPGGVRPLGVRNPDVDTGIDKQTRIQYLKKYIDIRFRALWVRMMYPTKLDILVHKRPDSSK